MKKTVSEKPVLRGQLHLYAAFIAAAAGAWLIYNSATRDGAVASAIYIGSLVSMLTISAIYHVPTWTPKRRLILRRIDHSAIFVLIAGTSTPLFILGLDPQESQRALTMLWIGAALGFLQSVFWVKAPKAFVAILCVALGWLAIPHLRSMSPMLGTENVFLLIIGGALYSLGALIYAIRRPNPFPKIFGYHEIFHALVILAAAFHYVVIYRVVT